MTRETQATVLALVKTRLNRLPSDTSLDGYLTARVASAVEQLEHTGIYLGDSPRDVTLATDYTVWQYQNRDSTGAMPDWLRLMRRERWLSDRGDDDDP